jgi:hypothetical protein
MLNSGPGQIPASVEAIPGELCGPGCKRGKNQTDQNTDCDIAHCFLLSCGLLPDP